MRRLSLPLLMLLVGCDVPGLGGSGKVDDTTDDGDGSSTDVDEDDDDGWEPCVETWVDFVGDEEPHVGDDWTVWLRCDGAILTGPTVIRLDPVEAAYVDENVLTWDQAGEVWLKVQTGTEWAETWVTVLPAT
ncbi:MAG: hypothetical protein H6742_12485 [Alphaproteobacteria bacterium]|nr:hypothetical protein [Alphaproteobacteria bacterium]